MKLDKVSPGPQLGLVNINLQRASEGKPPVSVSDATWHEAIKGNANAIHDVNRLAPGSIYFSPRIQQELIKHSLIAYHGITPAESKRAKQWLAIACVGETDKRPKHRPTLERYMGDYLNLYFAAVLVKQVHRSNLQAVIGDVPGTDPILETMRMLSLAGFQIGKSHLCIFCSTSPVVAAAEVLSMQLRGGWGSKKILESIQSNPAWPNHRRRLLKVAKDHATEVIHNPKAVAAFMAKFAADSTTS